MDIQTELFNLPDETHCLFEEWTYAQTTLDWPWMRANGECGRGFNGNAVCRTCPYGEGA